VNITSDIDFIYQTATVVIQALIGDAMLVSCSLLAWVVSDRAIFLDIPMLGATQWFGSGNGAFSNSLAGQLRYGNLDHILGSYTALKSLGQRQSNTSSGDLLLDAYNCH